MGEQKKLMLTNKSARTFVTSQGRFYPSTSKEFPEAEALKLLGYSKEILRTEDAIGDPKFKDRIKKLGERISKLESEVKAKDKEIEKLTAKKKGLKNK